MELMRMLERSANNARHKRIRRQWGCNFWQLAMSIFERFAAGAPKALESSVDMKTAAIAVRKHAFWEAWPLVQLRWLDLILFGWILCNRHPGKEVAKYFCCVYTCSYLYIAQNLLELAGDNGDKKSADKSKKGVCGRDVSRRDKGREHECRWRLHILETFSMYVSIRYHGWRVTCEAFAHLKLDISLWPKSYDVPHPMTCTPASHWSCHFPYEQISSIMSMDVDDEKN